VYTPKQVSESPPVYVLDTPGVLQQRVRGEEEGLRLALAGEAGRAAGGERRARGRAGGRAGGARVPAGLKGGGHGSARTPEWQGERYSPAALLLAQTFSLTHMHNHGHTRAHRTQTNSKYTHTHNLHTQNIFEHARHTRTQAS
jgi:hypothetical protein